MTTHENAVETIQEEYEQSVRKLQEVRNQQSVEVLRDSQGYWNDNDRSVEFIPENT